MIGPREKRTTILVCDQCDVMIYKTLGATTRYPTRRTIHYCKHEGLDHQVAFLKHYPKTPKWCPAQKAHHQQKGE